MKPHRVRTCVVTGFGFNADDELAAAFELTGSHAEKVHIRDIIAAPWRLHSYDIFAIPGGFSYGDHLGSGKVFASLLKRNLKPALEEFVSSGRLVIGICNGFQVLVKTGMLPNSNGDWKPEVSLIHNDCGKFVDRWVGVTFNTDSPCVWTRGLTRGELPIRHGEGRFIAASEVVLKRLIDEQLVVLRYDPDNPNGSVQSIAGICDPTGRIFGLMPHPEAYISSANHPDWTWETEKKRKLIGGWGLEIFRRGVEFTRYRRSFSCRTFKVP